MELIKMIEELNKAVDYSLSITYYHNSWSISSYRTGSLFQALIEDTSLEEAIREAYKIMKERV